MELIADSLLLAATVGAAIYCYVLAARLRRFTTLETGMGGAIAVLSAQVDDMTKALQKAQGVASGSEQRLAELTVRADVLAKRLELMVASLHDLPEPARSPATGPSFTAAASVADPGRARADAGLPMSGEEDEEPRRLRFVRRRAGARVATEDAE